MGDNVSRAMKEKMQEWYERNNGIKGNNGSEVIVVAM
jgi:hypothetical protein